jgi:hypothetical protein
MLLFAARPAHAHDGVSGVLYEFTANCEDCAAGAGTSDYTVHGQLVLDDYVLGTTISAAEFVYFTYDGSNLYHSFTIDASDLSTISGALPAVLPGAPAANIVIVSKYPFGATTGVNSISIDMFTIRANGTWLLGQSSPDFGNEASFAVPEPSTWAMMLLGFAGLGFAGYRGARKRSGAAAFIARR